jgi:hypothetical protein
VSIHRLKEAEAAFLERFPLGFADPGREPIRKRHKLARWSIASAVPFYIAPTTGLLMFAL